MIFEDEAGFRQDSTLHSTWARAGNQPLVPLTGQRKSIKVYGGVEIYKPAFLYMLAEKLNAETYIPFLELVAKNYYPQEVYLVQDNASFHKSPPVHDWFEENRAWIHPVYLPPYWPQLNATERVWHHVRVNATHNRYFPTFDELLDTLQIMLDDVHFLPQQLVGYLSPFF